MVDLEKIGDLGADFLCTAQRESAMHVIRRTSHAFCMQSAARDRHNRIIRCMLHVPCPDARRRKRDAGLTYEEKPWCRLSEESNGIKRRKVKSKAQNKQVRRSKKGLTGEKGVKCRGRKSRGSGHLEVRALGVLEPAKPACALCRGCPPWAAKPVRGPAAQLSVLESAEGQRSRGMEGSVREAWALTGYPSTWDGIYIAHMMQGSICRLQDIAASCTVHPVRSVL